MHDTLYYTSKSRPCVALSMPEPLLISYPFTHSTTLLVDTAKMLPPVFYLIRYVLIAAKGAFAQGS